MKSLVGEPFPEEFCLQGNDADLPQLWNTYAIAGYEKIYQARITKNHRQELGKLFLSVGGVCLDAGCGTGVFFELITQKIQPGVVYAVDWAEEMLRKADREAEKLQRNSKTKFKIRRSDLSKPWLCVNQYFDTVVSNQFINYLPGGWEFPLKEMSRVLKPGGYLYLGTFLIERKVWSLSNILKHAPIEFFRDPIATLKELECWKFRSILLELEKMVGGFGARFPSHQELINSLETIGFEEITVKMTYWGGGVALRARRK